MSQRYQIGTRVADHLSAVWVGLHRYGVPMSNGAAPQVIYDGTCGFCTKAVLWLRAHVHDGDLDLIASQSLDGSGLTSRGLTRQEVEASVWWIDETQRLNGHLAVGAALRRCGGIWSFAGIVTTNPPLRWFGPVIYRLVARYRRYLPGDPPSCAVDGHGAVHDSR